jgi:small GTP-binding protein
MQNVKVVVVGNGGAGKTSLLMSAANPLQDLRDVEYLPTVFDLGTVNFIVDDRPVSTGFWDTAGQEDYDRLRPLSYPQTDVFLLCVSPLATSNVDSIQNKWLPELRFYAPNVPILLVETMADVENSDVFDLVSLAQEEGLAGAARTSAHLREGVDELMQQAIRIGLWHQTKPHLRPQRTLLSIFWENIRFAISRRRTQDMPPAFFVGNSCEGSKTSYTCNICLEGGLKYPKMVKCFTGCQHRICRNCAKTYINSHVQEGKLQIECCDVEGRRCRATVSPRTIGQLCGAATLATYNKNLYANHFEYVEQLQESKEGKDVEFVTWAHDNTRNCPRCSVIIYRCSGCDHMKCKCGQSFNWSQAPKLHLPAAIKKKRERVAQEAALEAERIAKGIAAKAALEAERAAAAKAAIAELIPLDVGNSPPALEALPNAICRICKRQTTGGTPFCVAHHHLTDSNWPPMNPNCQSAACTRQAFGGAQYCNAHAHLADPLWLVVR